MGIFRHIAMQDLTPVMADDEKAVQNTKRERWDGEKVHRRNGLAVVPEERQPLLHEIWISRDSPDPSRDTPFREIETQLEQFAVNARRSPGRILGDLRKIRARTSLSFRACGHPSALLLVGILRSMSSTNETLLHASSRRFGE